LNSFTTLKAQNIFELFSIFVAVFFPRNVSRADWAAKDGAWASRLAAGTPDSRQLFLSSPA